MKLSVQELEAAINHWRGRRPASGSAAALSPEVKALATVYALMIYRRQSVIDTDTLDPAARQPLLAAHPQSDPSNPTNPEPSLPDASI